MLTNELIELANKNYHTFPTFSQWSESFVDTEKWDKYSTRLKEVISDSPDLLKQAQEHIKRAAAIETGAIEGLYQTDRGFTITAAAETAVWQAALSQKDASTRSLIEAQIQAYDHVLDLATQSVPLGEAHIRELHRVICKGQSTYKVYTPGGIQQHELPLGTYKQYPNHVLQSDGKVHSYSPVDMTASEMHRLCQELNSSAFIKIHPILQASYVHYCLTVIHPFADGNGRVARALASIDTYRSNSIPLLIADDTKQLYFNSLEAADYGDYQEFVNFIFERGIDSIRLLEESLHAASIRPIKESAQSIQQLYVSRGGYQQSDVDKAGYTLYDLFEKEMGSQLKLMDKGIVISYDFMPVRGGGHPVSSPSNRLPVEDGIRELDIRLRTKKPAEAVVLWRFVLEVPKDSGREDELLIRCIDSPDKLEARITEVFPSPIVALEMRLMIAVERILATMTENLHQAALAALQKAS